MPAREAHAGPVLSTNNLDRMTRARSPTRIEIWRNEVSVARPAPCPDAKIPTPPPLETPSPSESDAEPKPGISKRHSFLQKIHDKSRFKILHRSLTSTSDSSTFKKEKGSTNSKREQDEVITTHMYDSQNSSFRPPPEKAGLNLDGLPMDSDGGRSIEVSDSGSERDLGLKARRERLERAARLHMEMEHAKEKGTPIGTDSGKGLGKRPSATSQR